MLVQPGHTGFSLNRVFDSAVMSVASPASNLSIMARVTGTNFTQNLPDVSNNAVNTVTSVAGLSAQLNDANGAKATILEAKGQFESTLKNVQNLIYDTIFDAAPGQGLNSIAAIKTLGPGPNTGIADVALEVSSDAAIGGTASAIITAYNMLSAEFIKLTPDKRDELLAEVHARLTPSQDFAGQKKAPQVKSDYDFTSIKPKDLEAILLPPENHPEGVVINNALKHVDEHRLAPLENHNVIASLADGDTAKKVEALKDSGVDITQVLKPEFVAAVAAPELETGDVANAAQDQEPAGLDAAGIALAASALPETNGLIHAQAPAVSEAHAIIAKTIEPDPVPAAEPAAKTASADNAIAPPPDLPMRDGVGNSY